MAFSPAPPSETTGWNTSLSNNTEPTSGEKALGWTVDEAPPSSYFNWIQNTTEKWLVWVQSLTTSAITWAAAQTYTAASTFNGLINANFTLFINFLAEVVSGASLIMEGGSTLQFNSASAIKVNGNTLVGAFGFNATVAKGSASSITTGSTLCTFTPPSAGLYRVDVYANSPSASTPFVDLSWYDVTSGNISILGSIVMSAVGAASSPYLYTGSYVINCGTGGGITVAMEHHSSETITLGSATITGLT